MKSSDTPEVRSSCVPGRKVLMPTIEENIERLGGLRPPGGGPVVPMPEEEVAVLERMLGARLPESFRRFLTTYGMCSFRGYTDFTTAEPLPSDFSSDGSGHFDCFFGAASSDSYSIADVVAGLRDRLPDVLVPIGDTGFLDKICLGIAGTQRGKVYYWDASEEMCDEDYSGQGLPVPPDLKFRNVHLIADSFEAFLDQMYVVEDA